MSQRLRTVIALLMASGLVAGACGGETTDGDSGAAAPTTAPAVTEAPDAGPEPDEPDDDSDSSGSSTPDEPESTETPAESADEPEGPPPNIYDDPRGGVFDEFQSTFDRGDHPFTQLESFCRSHPAAENRVATDPGIEADSITLVHLRSRLEDLIDFGFAVPVGDPAEMFETFAAVVNEQCGGIRGRMIDMRTIEYTSLGATVEADRNAACIQATEDYNGVILLNSSGLQGSANLCIVEDHQTAFISTQGQSEEFMARGQDLLVSLSPTLEESLRFLARDLIAQGALEGRTIGVAAPDTPGQSEAVRTGLVEELAAAGIEVAVFDVLGCGGTISCTEGLTESVQRLRDEGVDVFINVLNILSAPAYIAEMVAQGFEPGDVQFYSSDFNSQAGELVSSKIVAFGGQAAGDLYNGAIIIDDANTGAYRLEGYEPLVYNEMCNDVYGANSPSGANHESEDRSTGSSAYGMVATVCDIVRIAARAIYDAGDNPTRQDIYEAMANLGPIDSNEMLPFSIRPGKTQAPDAIHTLVFESPCTKDAPFGEEQICVYPTDDYRPAPR